MTMRVDGGNTQAMQRIGSRQTWTASRLERLLYGFDLVNRPSHLGALSGTDRFKELSRTAL